MESDQQKALRTRDVIKRMVERIVDSERPTDRYAAIQSISENTAEVVYVGEESKAPDNVHVVKMGVIRPSFIGQRVRVGGPPDDRWIVDVVGQALVNSGGTTSSNLQVPTGVTASTVFKWISVNWGVVTSADFYEIQISTGPYITEYDLPLGDLGPGVACIDAATYSGWIMWSGEPVATRLTQYPGTADHFIGVTYDNGKWQYDNNSTLVDFTPVDSDRLVWEIDTDANTATSLEGTDTVINGIRAGYAAGDLVVTPEQYAGDFNTGEFDLEGTYLTANASDTVEATYQTKNTQFQTPNKFAVGDHYVQVRSSAGGAVSEWSDGVWVEIVASSEAATSDGFAPEDSPDVTVIPALGFVTAQWVRAPNNDPVTYSVHASLESGFLPTEANKIGETSLSFYVVSNLADGSRLPYDSPTFIRVVASDADGSAIPGAQGYGTPNKVETGDAGNLEYPGYVTDGSPPSSSPQSMTIKVGPSFVYLSWDHVSNTDPVTYEVHIALLENFQATANTLVLETPSNFAFASTLGAGYSYAKLSSIEQSDYHVRVWAKDSDGKSFSPSPAQSFVLPRLQGGEIDDQTITSDNIFSQPGQEFIGYNSILVAEAAIGAAQIADLNVTTIQNAILNTSNASIDWLQVGEANIGTGVINNLMVSEFEATNGHIDWLTVKSANIESASIGDTHIDNRGLNANNIRAGTIKAHVNESDIIFTGVLNASTIDASNSIEGAVLRTGNALQNLPYAEVKDYGISFYSNNQTGSAGGLEVHDTYGKSYDDDDSATVIRLSPPQFRTNTTWAPHLSIMDSDKWGGVAEFNFTDVVRVPGGTESAPGLEFGVLDYPGWSTEQGYSQTPRMGFYRDDNDSTVGFSAWYQWVLKLGSQEHRIRFGNSSLNNEFKFQQDGKVVQYRNGSAVWDTQGAWTSDLRKKVNVVAVNSDMALDIIRSVPVIEYEFDPERQAYPEGKRLGLAAQDVQKVFPQGVTSLLTPNDPKGDKETLKLEPSNMAALMWKAIAELDDRVQVLSGQ